METNLSFEFIIKSDVKTGFDPEIKDWQNLDTATYLYTILFIEVCLARKIDKIYLCPPLTNDNNRSAH